MEIYLTRLNREKGSVLMVTLFMASLFGMFLFYYLNLVQSQRTFVARSQAWNASLAVAEAGVEEALAQLNPGAVCPSINFATNNRGGPHGGLYGPVSRHLPPRSHSVNLKTPTIPHTLSHL